MGRSFTPQGGASTPFEGQELLSAFLCPPLQSSVNDYQVAVRAFGNASLLQLGATTAVNITGLAGWAPNRELTLLNSLPAVITLKNASGLSLVPNRFLFGADVGLAQNQGIKLIGVATGGWAVQGVLPAPAPPAVVALAASIHNTTAQAIPNNAFTLLSFDTVDFDTGAPSPFYASGTPTVLTAPVDGLYLACCSINWQAAAAGLCSIAFSLAGSTAVQYGQEGSSFANTNNANALTHLFSLAAGDTVSVQAYQGSSLPLNVLGGTTCTFGLMAIH